MSDAVYLGNTYEVTFSPQLEPPAFLKRPIIIIVNSFTPDGVAAFESYLREAQDSGQDRVQIHIDTFGGDMYCLLGMLEAMDQCTIPIDTVCTTKAMSAGAILFALGDKRYMSKYSTLMLHDCQQDIPAGTAVATISEHVNEGMRCRVTADTLIDKRRGREPGTITKEIDKHGSWFLTAKESLLEGLCDIIGPAPTLMIEISCDMWSKNAD
jgi:ATP-dependent protease ClpP protease subunit